METQNLRNPVSCNTYCLLPMLIGGMSKYARARPSLWRSKCAVVVDPGGSHEAFARQHKKDLKHLQLIIMPYMLQYHLHELKTCCVS